MIWHAVYIYSIIRYIVIDCRNREYLKIISLKKKCVGNNLKLYMYTYIEWKIISLANENVRSAERFIVFTVCGIPIHNTYIVYYEV
jgi:hypothetical protein